MMNCFRVVMATSLLFFADQSLAADCSGLDRKSGAYQTCMLRQENADRDIRLKVEKEREAKENESKEKEKSTAGEYEVYRNKMTSYGVFGAMTNAEKPTLSTLGCDYKNGRGSATDKEYFFYAAMFCEQPVIFLMAVNQSPLAQEFSGEIEGKKLEAVLIDGQNVMKSSKNYVLHRHPKGIVVYIVLKDSLDIFNEITEALKKRHSIEVFFKSEKQSTKFLLSENVPTSQ